jgi:hypothetical protein
MAIEKVDDIRGKRVRMVEEFVTIEALELQKAKLQAQIDRLQASMDMWQGKIAAIDIEIAELRAAGIVTPRELLEKPAAPDLVPDEVA